MKRLGLIGFAGSGKSTLLQKAQKDGFRTIDTDEMIEAGNVNIRDLILNGKDPEMRMHERAVVNKAIRSDAEIIAFGGGVHIKHIAWKSIEDSNMMIVFLQQSFEKCVERAPDRPLMKKLGMSGYKKLFDDRQNMYREASRKMVRVNNLSPDEVWIEVKSIWN